MNRTIPAAVTALVAALAFSCSSTQPLPPIPAGEGMQHIPGKIVWHALLTNDVEGAKRFYGGLCGWSFEATGKHSPYTTIRAGAQNIGTIVEVKDTRGMHITQWLSFMSVDDVDRAAGLCGESGVVLRGPLDLPGFGRVALVKDATGAPLVLVHTEGGDPADGVEPRVGTWLWNDYVTTNADAGVRFYNELVGYEAGAAGADNPDGYQLLSASGRARAGMFAAPENVGPHWLPYLRVADAQAAMERSRELGATVLMMPNPDIRNGSSAVIQDPNGAVLVLQQYPF
jgi:predicted enzyme related to lactoylglutathione lyase